MSIPIYDPTQTFILCGDTNAGKTSMINNFLQNITNTKCNFYAESMSNTTKITTVFHLKSNEYNFVYNGQEYGQKNAIDTFEKIQECYNKVSKECQIDHDGNCHIYIKEGNDNINIIDTIGKSSIMTHEKFDVKLKEITEYYPNHMLIHLSRMPNYDIMKSTKDIYVLTHSDLIDYEFDDSLENTHYEFIDKIKNKKLYMYSNTKPTCENKIKDTNVIFYGNEKCYEMIANMYFNNHSEMENVKTKNIADIEFDKDLHNAKCIGDIKKALYYYNNQNLIDFVKNYINENKLADLKYMNDLYQKAVDDRESKSCIAGNGNKRLMQILHSHFDFNCESPKFAKLIIDFGNECINNNKKMLNKNFVLFDKHNKDEIKKLSLKFTKKVLTALTEKCKQINITNKINEINKTNEINEINEINEQMNISNETNEQMNISNETNEQMNISNETNETNKQNDVLNKKRKIH